MISALKAVTCLFCFGVYLPLRAQLPHTTALGGNVSNSSGAPIGGVTVTAVNAATQDTYTAQTSTDGLYRLGSIRIGFYNVTAAKDGFQTITQKKLAVHANQTARADFMLTVGQISQRVEVAAVNPPISTHDADLKETIPQKSISDQPLKGGIICTWPGVIESPKSRVKTLYERAAAKFRTAFRSTVFPWSTL